MKPENDKFKQFLQTQGLKLTPERREILSGAFSLHTHFDAERLYDTLRERGSRLSRATVYRTLPLLVDSGLIRETLRCEGKSSYEHTYGHEHHDHLLCVNCGKIIEFCEDNINRLRDAICRQHDFEPVECRLGIRGLCKKCRGKK